MSENKSAELQEDKPVCEHCGCPEAVRFGGQWICVSCYEECGACCADVDE